MTTNTKILVAVGVAAAVGAAYYFYNKNRVRVIGAPTVNPTQTGNTTLGTNWLGTATDVLHGLGDVFGVGDPDAA